jgi:TRAP-type C4-dicarboxylate transport system permease small subunit
MGGFNAIVNKLVQVLKVVGAVSLTGMMLLTCADVTMRAFGHPILGAIELVGFMATVVLSCAMPYTHEERGHIGVDLLVRKFTPRTQIIIEIITGLMALVFFFIVGVQTEEYGETLRRSGEVSMTLELPSWIIVLWISLSFFVLSLVILVELVKMFKKAAHK